jgi:hypothetical protein
VVKRAGQQQEGVERVAELEGRRRVLGEPAEVLLAHDSDHGARARAADAAGALLGLGAGDEDLAEGVVVHELVLEHEVYYDAQAVDGDGRLDHVGRDNDAPAHRLEDVFLPQLRVRAADLVLADHVLRDEQVNDPVHVRQPGDEDEDLAVGLDVVPHQRADMLDQILAIAVITFEGFVLYLNRVHRIALENEGFVRRAVHPFENTFNVHCRRSDNFLTRNHRGQSKHCLNVSYRLVNLVKNHDVV